ncbi:MAG: outer membrane lipoprotein-sorting protein [Deltaproteobacteria bacterium]|nr:outer membrane lipoprotein-sorting protein [Deltaproteobacteria bacterium]
MANQTSAQDIISKMEQNFLKIENYQVNVSRIYYRDEVLKSQEEWRFFFQNPGLARIDVMLPKKVTLLINQEDIWQYILEEKKVVRRKIKHLREKERMLLVGKFLKPYEIEGWGLSISSKFGDRLRLVKEEVVKGKKCYHIECKPKTDDSQGLRLLVWIDRERLALVKKELYKEADNLISRTENENFLEIIPGIWLPRKVETAVQTEKGEIVKQLILRNIRMNESMPAKTFQFIPPKECEVMMLNGKGEMVKEQ